MSADVTSSSIRRYLLSLWRRHFGMYPKWLMVFGYDDETKCKQEEECDFVQQSLPVVLDCALFVEQTSKLLALDNDMEWKQSRWTHSLIKIAATSKRIVELTYYHPNVIQLARHAERGCHPRFYDCKQFLLEYEGWFIGFCPPRTRIKGRPVPNGIYVTKDWTEFAELLWHNTLATFPRSHVQKWFVRPTDPSLTYNLYNRYLEEVDPHGRWMWYTTPRDATLIHTRVDRRRLRSVLPPLRKCLHRASKTSYACFVQRKKKIVFLSNVHCTS